MSGGRLSLAETRISRRLRAIDKRSRQDVNDTLEREKTIFNRSLKFSSLLLIQENNKRMINKKQQRKPTVRKDRDLSWSQAVLTDRSRSLDPNIKTTSNKQKENRVRNLSDDQYRLNLPSITLPSVIVEESEDSPTEKRNEKPNTKKVSTLKPMNFEFEKNNSSTRRTYEAPFNFVKKRSCPKFTSSHKLPPINEST